ncbi:hypothetical protein NX059_007283 [Plenodomus lindquistii]|nr:hypothetical protein NX059_007283 [Plenodomus lindquistii]
MLSTFPHLTTAEFDEACLALQHRFQDRGSTQDSWTSVEIINQHGTQYLRITKPLNINPNHAESVEDQTDELDEVEDIDEQCLPVLLPSAIVNFDIIVSPTYLVPTLYIHISDPMHRFPPTMNTLHSHLVPPEYRSQTDSVGVMGGVTIGDHPVTGRPVFFIHPCQTAGLMDEVAGKRKGGVTAEEYLLMWIGALGGCVGLNVPMGLIKVEEES